MAEPKVRFMRDDGSSYPTWTAKSFSNTFDALNNNTYSRDMLNYEGGEAKNIHYGDILVKFGSICDVQKDSIPYVNRGLVVQKFAPLENGDIILADTAEDETVGKAVEIYNTKNDVVISGLHTMACRPTIQFAPRFLGYYMNSNAFHDRLRPFMQGIKVTSIGRSNISNVSLVYPESLEEQQKIADFLSSVDDVISTSEQEVANLETQKKAVMKKIFSQEVRFKRADGSDFPEWEEKALGELAEFSKGQGYTKSDLSDTGCPIILYGRLYTKYQTVISEVDTFAEMKPRSVLSKKGDVIVPASGETAEDISVAAVVDADGIILGGDINIIHPCDAVLPNYLAYSLTFGTPHQEMAKRAQGKSIVHLHNDDLKAAVIIYPCLEEQHLIADFLSDFDEAIAAAKEELELWKELKKGLLQQMFV